jgi:hypothetical protein
LGHKHLDILLGCYIWFDVYCLALHIILKAFYYSWMNSSMDIWEHNKHKNAWGFLGLMLVSQESFLRHYWCDIC